MESIKNKKSFTINVISSFQMSNTIGNQPISRSGSARSFNTTFGRAQATTPSPRAARAHLGAGAAGSASLPGHYQQQQQQQIANQNQQEFLRQQQEYQRRQQELAAQQQMQQQQLLLQQQQQLQAQQAQMAHQQQLERERQIALQRQQQLQQQQQRDFSVKDTVRDIIASHDFGYESRPKSSHAILHPEPGRSRIIQVRFSSFLPMCCHFPPSSQLGHGESSVHIYRGELTSSYKELPNVNFHNNRNLPKTRPPKQGLR